MHPFRIETSGALCGLWPTACASNLSSGCAIRAQPSHGRRARPQRAIERAQTPILCGPLEHVHTRLNSKAHPAIAPANAVDRARARSQHTAIEAREELHRTRDRVITE